MDANAASDDRIAPAIETLTFRIDLVQPRLFQLDKRKKNAKLFG